ncbi:VOC family protein [Paracoccus spongiarum]|uniref:VOC family protein n=1 Tax=Paracoccus spongiarum TaxID=3064387 RepID=A0ABT9JAS7_9RHOB|nr:VOC family protein [Paracoccus sp. 2205BS29-5]MDP5306830.1 VOC family protein [Paracoccus sp. 2205BS29-5]
MTPKVRTCLWFADHALEAAGLYVGLLPDSRITAISRYPEGQQMAQPGRVLTVDLILAGTPYQLLNGGPHFSLSEAASISVATEDQAETDRLWTALIADGGAESQCGWLKDRFGLSWQIVPRRAAALMSGPQAGRVWPALMQMRRIDIAALEAAAGEAGPGGH